MSKHRFGTVRLKVKKLKVGTPVKVILGPSDKEYPAVIAGPVRTKTVYDELLVRSLWRTILLRVGSENLLREVAVERLIVS